MAKVTDTEIIDAIKLMGYREGGNQKKLSELLGVTPAAVSQRINKLIDLGIIDQDWHPIPQDRVAKPGSVPKGYENYHQREERIRNKVKNEVMKNIEKILFP